MTRARPPSGCTTSTSMWSPGQILVRRAERHDSTLRRPRGCCAGRSAEDTAACRPSPTRLLLPGEDRPASAAFNARGVFQHSTTLLRTARAHAGIVCMRGCRAGCVTTALFDTRCGVTSGAVPGRASGRRMLQTMPAKVLHDHRPRRGRTSLRGVGVGHCPWDPRTGPTYRDVPLRLPASVTAQARRHHGPAADSRSSRRNNGAASTADLPPTEPSATRET